MSENWKRKNPDRRTPTLCGRCNVTFLRTQNTRYCSDLCRLLSKVAGGESCWIWLATIDRHGYGTFYMDGRNIPAHRASFLLAGHPIPSGLELDHLCRVRSCVRPSHLEPVTRAENIRRGMRWPNQKVSA